MVNHQGKLLNLLESILAPFSVSFQHQYKEITSKISKKCAFNLNLNLHEGTHGFRLRVEMSVQFNHIGNLLSLFVLIFAA